MKKLLAISLLVGLLIGCSEDNVCNTCYGDFSIDTIKVVVRSDKSFYVRHHIDNEKDGILLLDYYTAYEYNKNCIMMKRYCVGTKNESDDVILAKNDYHNCNDSQSPMFTANFGPMFSNHGYSTPRVDIPNHGLTASDIGSEWTDQNNYHYTIGKISGITIYLLPVIHTTYVDGEETRDWKWYSSPYPTKITRVGVGGETLQIIYSSRWDYQISELKNVRIVINGKDVGEGTYYCKDVVLSYEQIGYNPIFIQEWWPNPIYNDVMMKFDRIFTINGGKGFLSLTSNTVLNNFYPFPLYHYIDVVPQFPFQIGDYKPYIYIPKMKKVISDIDFGKEFVSVNKSHASVSYKRNTNDIIDVNDMPDRAFCYLKNDNNDILYGCAGGHSLVRGMSVKAVRNNHIKMNGQIGSWNPKAGNKHYNNIILTTNEKGNILPSTFTGEFEGYMCWYKPINNIHCFYHKTKEGYVVYIHTNQAISKGYVILPVFMNNLSIDSIVEKTDGISLQTSTVVDSKVFFSSNNTAIKYNYLVMRLK